MTNKQKNIDKTIQNEHLPMFSYSNINKTILILINVKKRLVNEGSDRASLEESFAELCLAKTL